MRWRMWLPLVMSVALGLVAAKLARDVLLKKGPSTAHADGAVALVAVAKGDLDPGHGLTEADLDLRKFPEKSIPRGSFTTVQELIGRVLVTPVAEGQPFIEPMFAPAGSGSGPQALVPHGMRAITLDVTESSGVAGLLVPGCRVDVVCTLQDSVTQQMVTRVLVENARVLAVGQSLPSAHKPAEKPGEVAHEMAGLSKTVTLVVAPRDVASIELASMAGRTRLVLRGSQDQTVVGMGEMTVGDVLGREKPTQQPEIDAEKAKLIEQLRLLQEQVNGQKTGSTQTPRSDGGKRFVEVINGGTVTRVEVETSGRPSAVAGERDGSATGAN